MLRITLQTANQGLFVLEGRLTGLWAKELLRVARGTNEGLGNIFDLQEVFFVDGKGEEALRLLGGLGGKFIAETAYGKDLCNRLKLDRIGPSEVVKHRSEGHRMLRRRPAVEASGPNGMTADSSSCAQ